LIVFENHSAQEALVTVLTFRQTIWFGLICFVLAIVLVGFIVQVRRSQREARRYAEDQADERIKIARELYDSLHQGLQGVLLSFHAATQAVPYEHPSRGSLERALASADRIILESRERINRLSLEHLNSVDLEPAIRAVADELSSLSESLFTLVRIGKDRPLNALIVDEILFIAREAITNSYRHSRASEIGVTLGYGKEHFTLTCYDDGQGFDILEFEESAARGHWGLRCIARRAARIGANFECLSKPGAGTEIRVVIPSQRAYPLPLRLGTLFTYRTED
jgi:signal transduction histidine kinase